VISLLSVSAALGGIAVFLGQYTGMYESSAYYDEAAPVAKFLLFALAAAIVIGASLAAFSVLRGRATKELTQPVASVAELERAAEAYVRRLGHANPGTLASHLLYQRNPHYRYAATLLAGLDPHDVGRYTAALARAFTVERSAVVRTAIARQLARVGDPDALRAALDIGLDRRIPEVAYLLEPGSQESRPLLWWLLESDDDLVERLPPPLLILAALVGHRVVASALEHGPPRRSLPLVALGVGTSSYQGGQKLADAFADHGDVRELAGLTTLSESMLRQAIRDLSPFEDGGLGTCDELIAIGEVDQLYLFFEHLAYLREYGTLNGAPPA
jgi:hypothetical protein